MAPSGTNTTTFAAAARPAPRPLRGLVLILAVATAAAAGAMAAATRRIVFVKPPVGGLRRAGVTGNAADDGRQHKLVKAAATKDRATTSPTGDGVTSGGSDVEDEAMTEQLRTLFVDLLSVVFWAIFTRMVIQNYIIIPEQLRAAAIVEGLGGGVLPLYPPV